MKLLTRLMIVFIIFGIPWTGRPAEATDFKFIDTHNHLHGGRDGHYMAGAGLALKKMNQLGISKMIIMPPPGSPGHRGVVDINNLIPVIRSYPQRFALMGGGGDLNVMIMKAKLSRKVAPNLKKRFKKKALELIKKGVVGFGELTAEHFSFSKTHPYESVAPDHELFLLLADIAGERGLPIDFHMEAVAEDIPFPKSKFLNRSYHNPDRLKANLPGFERLISHNRNAKIIWAHAGWCNTGYRTATLCRRLLADHPNLYMSLKLSPEGKKENRILEAGKNTIKQEWLSLFQAFPDRFIIGTDQFYGPPGSKQIGPQKTEAMSHLISLLPKELKHHICVENVKHIFNL
ncbi:MAG: amidohydrolase family protein [Desulfobacula sp.]|jgi:hypothetical protein|nr:amidohydrolase family protein [Desulfobacula sp.]